MSATVVQWLKKVGEFVEKDEPLLEVMTDKVNSEIPSPFQGILQATHAAVDEEIEVGQLLCVIGQHLSPAVQTLVQENRLTGEEVRSIPATGEGGRLSKKDVESHLLSPLRKAISKQMVLADKVPTATLIDEVPVTSLMKHIAEEKQKHQTKLTITSYMIRAAAAALKELPLLNATLEGDQVVLHKDANIGIAVSVEQGVLVPVISACQNRCVLGIAEEVTRVSTQIREGRWRPEGPAGTFTITNFGMGKVPIGIPMIVPGQAAILGMGAIQKKVLVDEEERFFVGQTLFLSLTFDHRLVDGMYASRFLQVMRQHLCDCR